MLFTVDLDSQFRGNINYSKQNCPPLGYFTDRFRVFLSGHCGKKTKLKCITKGYIDLSNVFVLFKKM